MKKRNYNALFAENYGMSIRSVQRWLAHEPPAPLAFWFDLPDFYAALPMSTQAKMTPRFRQAIIRFSQAKVNPVEPWQIQQWLAASRDAVRRGKEVRYIPASVVPALKKLGSRHPLASRVISQGTAK